MMGSVAPVGWVPTRPPQSWISGAEARLASTSPMPASSQAAGRGDGPHRDCECSRLAISFSLSFDDVS